MSDGLVGIVEKYVRKGSKLYIEGENRTRKWTDRDGNEKYTTEVVLNGFDSSLVMLDGKEGGGNSQRQTRQDAPPQNDFDLEDEIPF